MTSASPMGLVTAPQGQEVKLLAHALDRHGERLSQIAPDLRRVLGKLDDSGNLLVSQAFMLAATAIDLQPDVVIDLGTGNGNSAVAFALSCGGSGCAVHTFDLFPGWDRAREKLGADALPRIDPHVHAVVGDLTKIDFAPLLANAQRILIFWDAHGYAIADHVLCHLMPIIADKKHLVVCHDMTDNRVNRGCQDYHGSPFWRGIDGASAQADIAYVNLGWVSTRVEQVVPILDFCWRNAIELQSLDYELHALTSLEDRQRLLGRVGLDEATRLHMTYFALGDAPRQFPACAL